MQFGQTRDSLSSVNLRLARNNGRVSLSSEPLLARATLAAMNAHEPLAERWESASNLLRETFAEAYRSAVGVDPSRREELRQALEALRDGRTQGDVSVESILGRLRLR